MLYNDVDEAIVLLLDWFGKTYNLTTVDLLILQSVSGHARSRVEIMNKTNLNKNTVYSHVDRLCGRNGWLEKHGSYPHEFILCETWRFESQDEFNTFIWAFLQTGAAALGKSKVTVTTEMLTRLRNVFTMFVNAAEFIRTVYSRRFIHGQELITNISTTLGP